MVESNQFKNIRTMCNRFKHYNYPRVMHFDENSLFVEIFRTSDLYSELVFKYGDTGYISGNCSFLACKDDKIKSDTGYFLDNIVGIKYIEKDAFELLKTCNCNCIQVFISFTKYTTTDKLYVDGIKFKRVL